MKKNSSTPFSSTPDKAAVLPAAPTSVPAATTATASAYAPIMTKKTDEPTAPIAEFGVTETMDEAGKRRMLGYVRVSTREQNEDRQVIAMREFGVPEDCILVEKQSGKDFNRPIYQRLVASLREGDILVIKSIDRLGRNYEEIIEQWRILTKEKKAAIVVIDMPLLDTRKEHDLTGTLVADLVLQLLSYVAETERRFIKQRQAEGIAAAKARGVRFGPKEMEKPTNYDAVMTLHRWGDVSGRSAAKLMGVSRGTFMKWLARERAAHPDWYGKRDTTEQ